MEIIMYLEMQKNKLVKPSFQMVVVEFVSVKFIVEVSPI